MTMPAQCTHAEAQQFCLAHLIRDAQYAIDHGDTTFAPQFKAFLKDACAVGRRRSFIAAQQDYLDDIAKWKGHRRIGPESCPLGVSGVGNVAATSDRDERSFKLSVTGKTVSVTETLSATARNVGNKQFSTADLSAAPPSN
jgi:hypothetical protein